MPNNGEVNATPTDLGQHFLDLHRKGDPLLLPNPWDRGSAIALVTAGYHALATTSSGYAATLGRFDGAISLDEVIEHTGDLVEVVQVPINCDFENGFADEPETVAANVTRLLDSTPVAGFSIEDYDGHTGMYDLGLAVERVEAAVAAARSCGRTVVVTARAENFIRGVEPTSAEGMADTIERLQRFGAVGADALYAPGLMTADQISAVVSSVDQPVNVLALPGTPSVPEMAELGVARISVGGAFYLASLGGLADAAKEWLEQGTSEFWAQAGRGMPLREQFLRQTPDS